MRSGLVFAVAVMLPNFAYAAQTGGEGSGKSGPSNCVEKPGEVDYAAGILELYERILGDLRGGNPSTNGNSSTERFLSNMLNNSKKGLVGALKYALGLLMVDTAVSVDRVRDFLGLRAVSESWADGKLVRVIAHGLLYVPDDPIHRSRLEDVVGLLKEQRLPENEGFNEAFGKYLGDATRENGSGLQQLLVELSERKLLRSDKIDEALMQAAANLIGHECENTWYLKEFLEVLKKRGLWKEEDWVVALSMGMRQKIIWSVTSDLPIFLELLSIERLLNAPEPIRIASSGVAKLIVNADLCAPRVCQTLVILGRKGLLDNDGWKEGLRQGLLELMMWNDGAMPRLVEVVQGYPEVAGLLKGKEFCEAPEGALIGLARCSRKVELQALFKAAPELRKPIEEGLKSRQ